LDDGHFILALIAAMAVFAIVITAFGNQPGNLWSYLGGYGSYLQRGLQEGLHTKPWHYYGGLLLYSRIDGGPIWSESLILVLGGIGAAHFIRQKDSGPTQLVRTGKFLAWNTIFCLLIFSLMPYKTPWNILGFQVGTTLLAGQGAVVLYNRFNKYSGKIILTTLLVAGMVHLVWQSALAATEYDASPQNPYVYGHTSNDIGRLVDGLERIAAAEPAGHNLPVQIVAKDSDYWPLPWDLRRFSQVYWWNTVDSSVNPAPIIIARTAAADRDSVEAEIAQYMYAGFQPGERRLYVPLFDPPIQLRPGVHLSTFMTLELMELLNSQVVK
jgi:predicted membrane-bound mannosyltransferase